jgi:surface protein
MALRSRGAPRRRVGIVRALLFALVAGAQIAGAVPVFADRWALKVAVDACLAESPDGLCPDEPIGTWDVSAVTDMKSMFYNANAFNQDLSTWDVSSVTDMTYMFMGAAAFNKDLSAWDVSAVTDMQWMFAYDNTFNKDLSAWDVSKVTDMDRMFLGAAAFNQVLCSAIWLSTTATQFEMFLDTAGNSGICTALPPSAWSVFQLFLDALSSCF